MISESVLNKYRATVVHLNKGKMLFQEGEAANFFYIVKSGRVKMSNYSDDGREFVQGYFSEGQSFGEPPFFSHGPYPASAVAVDDSKVWKVSHHEFLKLLKNNFEIHLELTRILCDRLIYKSTMLSELAIEEAEHRLTTLIQYLVTPVDQQAKTHKKLIFTRQQLADMTGLRVETVIRSVKSLEKKRFLEIDKSGKIIWKRQVK
ncbi:MAG: Crp/Fnr family transcriptional regulator [Bacteroidota bacterium]